MPTPETFPRPLLALDDDQLRSLMAAAKPLQPADRPAFLESIAANLQTLPAIGPGALHRLLAEAQAAFLRGRALDGTGNAKTMSATRTGPGRPRKSDWVCKPGRRRRAL